MIDGLLFIARADNPTAVLDRVRFDARREVDAVIEFHEAQAAEKEVTVTCEGSGDLIGDSVLFRRAISNLLANALKHTPPSGTISIRVTPDGRHVTTVVADTGQGIASEDLPHIFDRAYTGANGAHNTRANAGLGLAIVKRILDLHDCRIEVSSHVGRGAAFRFELPVAA